MGNDLPEVTLTIPMQSGSLTVVIPKGADFVVLNERYQISRDGTVQNLNFWKDVIENEEWHDKVRKAVLETATVTLNYGHSHIPTIRSR